MFRILVIEDNESDAAMLKFLLSQYGYEADFVTDPIDANERLSLYVYHLILLDWYLPKMSGLEFLKRIKRNPSKKEIPIVMMSGRNEAKDVKMAVKEGVSHYLIKPLDPLILKNKLSELFSLDEKWSLTYLPKSFKMANGVLNEEIVLRAISEVELVVATHAFLKVGEIYSVQFAVFKELGIEELSVKITKSSEVEGSFHYNCSPVGIKEEELKKIRLLCRTFEISSESTISSSKIEDKKHE